MNVIFITRCYKPTNIQLVKNNLRDVFARQIKHSYVHYLLVDMSYNLPLLSFKCFEDEHTKAVFIYDKKDYYNSWGIDQIIKSIPTSLNSWVYILDDDNLITNNFLSVFENCLGDDALVVNNNALKFTEAPEIGNVVGKIDVSNYIVKLEVFKQTNFYNEDRKSYESDGLFFEKLLKKQCKIKCTNQYVITKSALRRPLNVLRKDL